MSIKLNQLGLLFHAYFSDGRGRWRDAFILLARPDGTPVENDLLPDLVTSYLDSLDSSRILWLDASLFVSNYSALALRENF